MTATTTTIYQTLREHPGDSVAMLQHMVEHLRENRRAVEMFEAKKLVVRAKLGVPLVVGESDTPHPEEVERELELGLLEACREAGTMLLEDKKVAEGWMYLRPTGDLDLARKLLQKVEINDENYDAMLQVLLNEGIDVGRGFQAILDQQGTCNSITFYDQNLVQRPKIDRRAAAQKLLAHLYNELSDAVRGDIARREAPAGDDETLGEMIASRPWVLGEGGYHLDTTHISSTVQICSLVESPEELQRVWELTQYGRSLNQQFQYPGEEPFVDFYAAYSIFYGVLLGKDVEAGLKYFERKARSVNPLEHGTAPIETYVNLLDRTGNYGRAIEAATELVPDSVPPQRIVPLMVEIATKAKAEGDLAAFDPILDYCQKRGDLLGYAATLAAMAEG